MNKFFIYIFWVVTALIVGQILSVESKRYINTLQEGYNLSIGSSFTQQLQIFCYPGKPKYITNLWQTVGVYINHPTNSFTQYDGATPELVEKAFSDRRYSWISFFPLFRQKYIKLDPFEQNCIGIETNEKYNVALNIIRIDYWNVIFLITGVFIYLSARNLSGNSIFYYLCGIILGICTSFLILIYFVSKLFPKKPLMYGVAACGWTIGIYFLQLIWDNLQIILKDYLIYVLWYTFISGFISFIICYLWGPVKNERTKNLMRWGLQILGLITIYQSTHFKEAAMGQIIILVLFHNIPSLWILKLRKYWKKKFPPKVKLLSNDQYYEQGVRETSKALEELKTYCLSPQCNQWKTVLKLKNVKRFASFIEGSSHLSDEEILEYETSITEAQISEDEEISEDDS